MTQHYLILPETRPNRLWFMLALRSGADTIWPDLHKYANRNRRSTYPILISRPIRCTWTAHSRGISSLVREARF